MEYNAVELSMRIAMWINKWDSDPRMGYDNPDYWIERIEQNIESVYEDFDSYGGMLIYQSEDAERDYLAILDDINELAIVME